MSDGRLQAVIWDLDGVIADTGDAHFQAWQDVFGKRGTSFSHDDFMRFFGRRHDVIIEFALGKGLPAEEFDAVTEEKQQSYRRRVVINLKPLPGAIDLLKSLNASGVKCAIASSAPMENITIILHTLDIEEFFQVIVSGTEVPLSKPDPRVFVLAAQRLEVPPANCVVIEDAIAGVSGAKQAGMKAVAVTNSHPADTLEEADLVVDSLEKVDVETLRKLFRYPGDKKQLPKITKSQIP